MTSVRAARDEYYAQNGFSDAMYRDRWVKLKLGPLPIVFPNTASRRAALPMHDLHHVATGYTTLWRGEWEIGAWEVAGGCARHMAAWVLDLGALATGMLLAPRRTFRAFVRGRHSTNLYQLGWSDALLELSVDELRAKLGLDRPAPRATWSDILAFAGWGAAFLVPPALALGLVIHRLRA